VAFAQAACRELIVTDGKERGLLAPERFRALLAESRGVIGSAGSNLIAECVLSGTPLLALYREGDVEQTLNASWLAAAGVGMASSFERLDAGLVQRFVARARAGDFVQVALREALPALSTSVLDSLRELLPVPEAAAVPERARLRADEAVC
jgi:hypothetical protein